jgi:hypothetical protein
LVRLAAPPSFCDTRFLPLAVGVVTRLPGVQTLVPSPAWTINVSGNGSRVIAGFGDRTVRWFGSANGNALLTLFLDPIHLHWIISTQ